MALTEQELRQHLEAAARQANAPRFTIADVAGRIRRRRAKMITAASTCLAAVAALAVAIPVGLLGGTSIGTAAHPMPSFRVPFTVLVNGQPPSELPSAPSKHPKQCGRSPSAPCPPGPEPGYIVTSGERLTINVSVTIPARAKVTGLWLGFSTGRWGPSRTGPSGMWTTLAHPRGILRGGRHTFRLTWTVPAKFRHARDLWLAASWYGVIPGADVRPAQTQPMSVAVGQALARLDVSH